MMLGHGTERERVLIFYFSRLQRNSRVNLIFSGLFLKRLLYYGYVIRYLASYDKKMKNKNFMVQWLKNQPRYFVHYIERNQLYDAITIANPIC
jgi:hypothetical protein